MTTHVANTSAGGSMLRPVHFARAGVVGVFLFASGLSAIATGSSDRPYLLFERTIAGPFGQIETVQVETSATAILEVRRRSGLTWEELSDLFNVSRRSVHHWASGKVVSAGHDRFIRQMLATIRYLDRGEASRTRDLLLSPDSSGVAVIDLLKAGSFDEVISRAQGVPLVAGDRTTPLSHAAQEARRPQAPAFLLGARQDRPDIPAKARIARAVRVPKATG